MLSAPRKQHRKVRTGCRTCKLRRVKCDETFPVCRKCSKLGQICDGYGVWGGGGAIEGAANGDTRHSTPLATRLAHTTMANTIHRSTILTSGLRVTSEEQIYLQWFIHGTATTPPRIFNSPFWDPMILQATASEPMILQALLALSAAHKRHVLDPENRARDGLPPDPLETFLLKHYGSALRGLQSHLDGKEETSKSKWFIAATMCSIFVLLNLLRGRFQEASVHLKTGAHIAERLIQDPGAPRQNSILTQFFTRLQYQTAHFWSNSRFKAVDHFTFSTSELRFASPSEAGQYLDDLVEQIAYLAQQTRQMPKSATASVAMHHEVCHYLLSCFESWWSACNATIAELGLNLTPTDAAAYEALRLRYKVSKGIAEACIGPNYTVEVKYLAQSTARVQQRRVLPETLEGGQS